MAAKKIGAIAAVLLVAAWLYRKRDEYDGLDGTVSFSSRMIAAARAVESDRKGALFHDPLAKILAGERALAKARARAAEATQRTLRFPIRVRYFDDAILEALGAKHAASFSPPWDATPHDAAPRATPQQVVMLGAGMDSRPWRLPLPPGVRWFEIDRVDVLNAKCKALAKAGAALGPTCKDSDACVQVPPPPSHPRHPLHSATLSMVPADLSSPNWTDRLTAAGFDPSLRTVWVAEGLLMYLPEHAVSQLLSACRAASPAGSVFLINTVTRVFRRSKELSDLGTEGLGADDIARIRPGSAAEAGVSGDGGGEATADVGPKGRGGADGGGAVGTPQGRSGRARGSLMDEWQWVCDPDPTEYLRERGWETVARVWRGHPEMSYGRVPEEEQSRVFPESRPGARFGNSLFIRAVTA